MWDSSACVIVRRVFALQCRVFAFLLATPTFLIWNAYGSYRWICGREFDSHRMISVELQKLFTLLKILVIDFFPMLSSVYYSQSPISFGFMIAFEIRHMTPTCNFLPIFQNVSSNQTPLCPTASYLALFSDGFDLLQLSIQDFALDSPIQLSSLQSQRTFGTNLSLLAKETPSFFSRRLKPSVSRSKPPARETESEVCQTFLKRTLVVILYAPRTHYCGVHTALYASRSENITF